MIYKNLEVEMVRKNVTKKQIAECIGKTYGTVLQKLNGICPFTLDEAFAIHRQYFSETDFDELFTTTDASNKGA